MGRDQVDEFRTGGHAHLGQIDEKCSRARDCRARSEQFLVLATRIGVENLSIEIGLMKVARLDRNEGDRLEGRIEEESNA